MRVKLWVVRIKLVNCRKCQFEFKLKTKRIHSVLANVYAHVIYQMCVSDMSQIVILIEKSGL